MAIYKMTYRSANILQDSYDEFLKDVPQKDSSDTKDIRSQIITLFKEKGGVK